MGLLTARGNDGSRTTRKRAYDKTIHSASSPNAPTCHLFGSLVISGVRNYLIF